MTVLPEHETVQQAAVGSLAALGVAASALTSGEQESRTPITGRSLVSLRWSSPAEVTDAVTRAHDAFGVWHTTPAPHRGELVRVLGELLREHKDDLGALGRSRRARSAAKAQEGRDDRHLHFAARRCTAPTHRSDRPPFTGPSTNWRSV